MATILGTSGSDSNLAGTASDDTVLALGGADTIDGGAGNDNIIAGAGGSDQISGGTGSDTLVLSGTLSSYTVSESGGSLVLTGPGGVVETLTGIETIVFDNTIMRVVGAGSEYTLQGAINAAGAGETVMIASGTYTGQILVDGKSSLTIAGVPGGTVEIKAPADVVETVRSSSDRELHGVVTVKNGSDVQLKGLTVNGDGRANTVDENGGAGQANYVGVIYRNASGGLTNVNVIGVRDPYEPGTTAGGNPVVSGMQRGVGVQVDNDTQLSFSMTGGTISDFQKNATVFNNANLNVTGVTITGGGAQTIIAQNGFQVLNSTGTISGNTITGIGYAGPAFAYSGAVLAYDNTNLNITNNTIVGSNNESTDAKVVGIFVFSSDSANNGGTISGNTISFVDEGIDVTGAMTGTAITVGANTVSNIDLTDPYAQGIFFQPDTSTLGFNTTGTPLLDSMTGSSGNDMLSGLGGDDTLNGGAGNDTLDGGEGNDTLNGSAGADSLIGGAGTDTATYADSTAGVTADLASSSANSGEAVGDRYSGVENLTGSSLADTLSGDGNNNRLQGGDGADMLDGRGGADTLDGGDGNDAITFDNQDSIIGGAGSDFATAFYSAAGIGITTHLASVEGVYGSAFNDVFNAAGQNVGGTFYGYNGNDAIYGSGFDDFISGGAGADTIDGGAGNDAIEFDSLDTVSGGAGFDFASAFYSTAGINIDTAAAGIEGVYGTRFNDVINASSQSSGGTFFGYDGNDVIHSSASSDTINGGNGFDYVTYAGASSAYSWSFSGGNWQVTETATGTVDTLTSVEVLRFSNGQVVL